VQQSKVRGWPRSLLDAAVLFSQMSCAVSSFCDRLTGLVSCMDLVNGSPVGRVWRLAGASHLVALHRLPVATSIKRNASTCNRASVHVYIISIPLSLLCGFHRLLVRACARSNAAVKVRLWLRCDFTRCWDALAGCRACGLTFGESAPAATSPWMGPHMRHFI
jgi:hypothetical protein